MANLPPLLSLLLLCLQAFESIGFKAPNLKVKSKWEHDYGSTETGLVLVGGESAELWTPDTLAVTSKNQNGRSVQHSTLDSCTLPPPPSPMYGHTVDLVNNTIILVHGDSSYQLSEHGWTQGPNTTYKRRGHTSTVTSLGLVLVGGYGSTTTLELLGSGFVAQLSEPRAQHSLSASTMILTGGDIYGFETSVTEYSDILQGNSVSRPLAPLLKGRSMHACGRYMVGDTIKLVVTGGQTTAAGSWNVASSTEILDYSAPGGTWKHGGGIVPARTALRGASLAGLFHVTGGSRDDTERVDGVKVWDPVTESWSMAGHLREPRSYHAVTEAPVSLVHPFCIPDVIIYK